MADPRTGQIVRALRDAFESRRGVFSDIKELLENQIPEGVALQSRQHANFLFYLISQDHGVKSAKLYERAKGLYGQQPQCFDPLAITKTFAGEDDPKLVEILRTLAVRYPVNGAKSWYRNSVTLCRDYGCDARQLFDSKDARTIMTAIRELHGFGPKTGGLLFRVFVGTGMASPSNIEDVDFPTDIHDTRIAAFTRIADVPTTVTEKTYMPYVRAAERAWKSACLAEGADWLQVDRALWILGSKGCARDRHYDCPIKHFCINGNGDLL